MLEKTERTPPSGHHGLTDVEIAASRARHGANVLTPPKRTPWWKLYLEKFDDPVIRILIAAAAVAIAAGAVDGTYIEGAGILCAILLSTALAFVNEYKAAKEFDLLDRSSDETAVRVVRNGQHASVTRRDIVVGDIVIVESGQEVPADGDALEAVNLLVDESRLTGESEPVAKFARPDGNSAQPKAISSGEAIAPHGNRDEDSAYPFHRLMRGTIVAEGFGTMRVSDVGDQSEAGRTARAATEEATDVTPLSRQLERLARVIGVAGFAAAALLFALLVFRGIRSNELRLVPEQWRFALLVFASALTAMIPIWLPIVYDAMDIIGVKSQRPAWLRTRGVNAFWIPLAAGVTVFGLGYLIFRYFEMLPQAPTRLMPSREAHEFLKLFMVAVTVVVVAVPEGLAMSVTLCLSYSVRRMAAAHNLVRRMHACETIGAATVICTDKTGTLTLNEMHVREADFAVLNAELKKNGAKPPEQREGPHPARNLIFQAIASNSTADLGAKDAARRVLGNPTEGALLLWIEELGGSYSGLRATNKVVERLAFSTEHKFMCSLLESAPLKGATERTAPARRVLHIKGAPEVVLDRCARVLTECGPEPVVHWRKKIEEKLQSFQDRGMRTLGFAFKDCGLTIADINLPLTDVRGSEKEGVSNDLKEAANGLIWLGFVAIQDPVRPEAPAAIQACRDAGIAVKIVTGDNVNTAREIARQVGLWSDGESSGALVSGPDFAAMSDDQALAAGQRLTILARSSPHDKLRLVKLLKGAGHVVAVTGDGTNDAPALNYASVGLSMGKSGTASAREASDIVLLDDSFNSIVDAIKWGRSLYENIQRFLVFQLTINAAALGLMLLGPFAGVKLPLTVTQMLWINIIMDTLAALALASEPAHAGVLDRPPRARDAFIITPAMALNILGTAGIFLAALLGLIFYFKRDNVFSVRESTIVFSVLVLLQFWNLFNARSFGRTASALKGIVKNKGFIGVAAAILLGQFLIVQFGGALFRTQPLEFMDWLKLLLGTSIVLVLGELRRWVTRVSKASAS